MANTKITAANIDSTSTGITLADLTVNGDINLGDNDKAIFGAGSDLQIYHDGSHSIITDQGTGSLLLRGTAGVFIQNAEGTENIIAASADGAVTLYYDNGAKLATTSTGIDVTGTVVADGITSSGNINLDLATPTVIFKESGAAKFFIGESSAVGGGSGFYDMYAAAGLGQRFFTGAAERMRIDSSGNVGIGTSSPTTFGGYKTLHFKNTGGDAIQLTETDGGVINQILCTDSSGGKVLLGSRSNHPTIFCQNDTERMRIDSSGNVGIGTTSPAQSLDTTGKIRIRDGGNTTIPSIQMGASGVDGLSLPSTNTVAFITNSAERMRIDSSGNAKFQGGIRLENGVGTGAAWITKAKTILAGSDNDLVLYTESGLHQRFYTNGIERMRITAQGNLLKNTTYDGFNAAQVIYATGTNPQARNLTLWNGGGSGTTFVQFVNSGGVAIGTITQNGTSAVSYNTSSDYRLKENVDYDFNALDRVAQLKPARFNFIEDADKTVDGFIAHEVQDIVPEAITGEKDGVREEEYEITPAVLDDDGNVVTEAVMETREVPEYQGIDQSKLVPLLTKAIQEQQTIIDDLKSRIEALEG